MAMATVTNQPVKFSLLQNVLATYIGKLFNDDKLAEEYGGSEHDALISAIWSAFLNGQYSTEIELEKCNKIAMIKALRSRVEGVVKLDVKMPGAWNQDLRNAIFDNTIYHPEDDVNLCDVTKRRYHYVKRMGLKEAKDFCDWMVDLMLDR